MNAKALTPVVAFVGIAVLNLTLLGCSPVVVKDDAKKSDVVKPHVQDPGLLGLWHLNGNLKNATGNKDATATGSYTWPQGILNKAMGLNGSTDYAQVTKAKFLNTESATVEAWVKLNEKKQAVIALTSSQYGLWLLPSGNVRFVYRTPCGPDEKNCKEGSDKNNYKHRAVTSDTVLDTGKWIHIAGTYDASSGVAKIYVNGKLDKTSPKVPVQGRLRPTENPRFLIGGSSKDLLNGVIDEVAVYGKALSADEIAKHAARQ